MKLAGLLLIVVVIIGGVVLGYVVPRLAGDRFASALIRLELAEVRNSLCPETSLGQIVSVLGGDNVFGNWLSQQIGAGIQVPGWSELVQHVSLESSYNPLSGIYSASYVLDETVRIGGFELRGGIKTPPLSLGLRVGSSRVDLQACKLEYSIVSPK